jgi:hypothetical protein
MNTQSQALLVQRHLAKGHSLTPLEAFRRFRILRLSGRIYDLRAQGWPIRSRMIDIKGKRVAEYSFCRKGK